MCRMLLYKLVVVLFNALPLVQLQESTYNVAVVEFGPDLNPTTTPDERLAVNVNNYLKLIEEVTSGNNASLDLMVFPESTLMYLNPWSSTKIPPLNDEVLCNSTDEAYQSFLKDFSCAAIKHQLTIVINLTEKYFCSRGGLGDCNDDGEIFYNSNVAIGSNGTIVARYRKWNLFGEYGNSKPTTLDLPIITIKNTTFGMMTCFDLQFGIPAINITKNNPVKNVIFPLNWISELPYLTALQAEQMWAQEFNVVLLAAGASVPTAGAGGSGIFLGKHGTLGSVMLPTSSTKALVYKVPVNLDAYSSPEVDVSVAETDALARDLDNFYMLIDPSIKDHTSVILNQTKPNTQETVCHGTANNVLCCDFNVSLALNETLKGKRHYTYHMVAFNGVRTYSHLYNGGVETCGIVACLNKSISSCGQRFPNYEEISWPMTFTEITLKGNFTHSNRRVQYPTTLLSSLRPLPVHHFTWQKGTFGNTTIRNLALKKPQSRLITFGIFGRDYDRDWDPIRNSTLTAHSGSHQRNLLECILFISLFGLITNFFLRRDT